MTNDGPQLASAQAPATRLDQLEHLASSISTLLTTVRQDIIPAAECLIAVVVPVIEATRDLRAPRRPSSQETSA
jgi:hypothetical protein